MRQAATVAGIESIDLMRALRAFTWAVELNGFSAAARRLGVTPGAVSKLIATLESALGRRLFQRTTRNLATTEEGKRLFELVRGPVQDLFESLALFAEQDTHLRGPVRVSLPTVVSRQVLLPHLGEFRARYPGIALDLRFDNRHVDLVSEGIDCAIGNIADVDSASLVARPLLPIVRVLCASPAYLAVHAAPSTLEQLAQHQLVPFRSPDSGRVQPWLFDARPGRGGAAVSHVPEGQVSVTDVDALLDLVRTGHGIGLLGVHHVADAVSAGELVQVLPRWRSSLPDISIYYPAQRHLAPRVRAFVDFTLECVQRSGLAARVRSLLAR